MLGGAQHNVGDRGDGHVRFAGYVACRRAPDVEFQLAGKALYDLVGGVGHGLVMRPHRIQVAGGFGDSGTATVCRKGTRKLLLTRRNEWTPWLG